MLKKRREKKYRGNVMKNRLLGCLIGLAVLAIEPAHAAELKVLAAEVVEPAVAEIAALFEKSSSHTLKVEYGFGVEQAKRVQGGETFDVLISPNGLIGNPATVAVLMPGSTKQFVRIGQGVAVKKGAPRPDVSTPDAFKAALLKAKSVAFVPTGQSGVATLKVFETLGIADEMKAKTKAVKVDDVVPSVAKGEAEFALFLNNYLVDNKDVDYAGPYPGNLQSFVSFSAGVNGKSSQSDAAAAFIKALTAPEATAAFRKHGMEPG
jgi:molybdate transport system substrate-binding protein